jgi:hypothetical protein
MTTENMAKVTQPMAMPCGPAAWAKQGVRECPVYCVQCATRQRTVSRQHSPGEAPGSCAVHAVVSGSHLAKGAHNAERHVIWGRSHSRRAKECQSQSVCSADLLYGALRAGEQHAHGAEPLGIGPEETAAVAMSESSLCTVIGPLNTRQDLRAAERADACAVWRHVSVVPVAASVTACARREQWVSAPHRSPLSLRHAPACLWRP